MPLRSNSIAICKLCNWVMVKKVCILISKLNSLLKYQLQKNTPKRTHSEFSTATVSSSHVRVRGRAFHYQAWKISTAAIIDSHWKKKKSSPKSQIQVLSLCAFVQEYIVGDFQKRERKNEVKRKNAVIQDWICKVKRENTWEILPRTSQGAHPLNWRYHSIFI